MDVKSRISSKVRALTPSASISIAEKTKEMRNKGVEVIDLSWGEPYLDTPEKVKDSGKKALDDNFTHYTNSRGIIELREAIGKKLENENDIYYNPKKEILVTPGAKQGIFYAIYTLVEKNAEVLVPEPYWLSYRDIIKMTGGKIVPIPTYEENGFKPSYEDISRKITRKTKAIIINSPNNPTGAVLERKHLKIIAEIAQEHDLVVISDEIYEKIIFDDRHHYSIASFQEMKERTITINGFSKAFAMTGWRLGYIATDKKLMDFILKVHQHLATCANSIAQRAATNALNNEKEVKEMVNEYQKKRDIVFEEINSTERLSCLKSEGTFYSFVNIKKLGMNSIEVSKYLLGKAHVSTVPGIEYGDSGEGYLRVSFAIPKDELTRGIENLKKSSAVVRKW